MPSTKKKKSDLRKKMRTFLASKGMTFEHPPTNSLLLKNTEIALGLSPSGAHWERFKRVAQALTDIPTQCENPFYNTKEWKELRYRALMLNDGRCECCGAKDMLRVDHVKPRARYPELELKLSNLQVLCKLCDDGKGEWDQTDWREPSLKILMSEAVEVE